MHSLPRSFCWDYFRYSSELNEACDKVATFPSRQHSLSATLGWMELMERGAPKHRQTNQKKTPIGSTRPLYLSCLVWHSTKTRLRNTSPFLVRAVFIVWQRLSRSENDLEKSKIRFIVKSRETCACLPAAELENSGKHQKRSAMSPASRLKISRARWEIRRSESERLLGHSPPPKSQQREMSPLLGSSPGTPTSTEIERGERELSLCTVYRHRCR